MNIKKKKKKVNPNIEENPCKESHHLSSYLVSTYYVPGWDSSQMSLGASSTSQVGTILHHLPPWSQVFLHVVPAPLYIRQQLPCQHNSFKRDPKGTAWEGVVLG